MPRPRWLSNPWAQNPWFESAAVAQRRAKKLTSLPPSGHVGLHPRGAC
jgi:pre-mycofactocin synthase